jgi:hypothetical protein
LLAIRPLNEALHLVLPQIVRESYRQNHLKQDVFTQPGTTAVLGVIVRDGRSRPKADLRHGAK